MITLRPHQEKTLDEVRAEIDAGRHPIIVSPCGSGKGTLASYIVQASVANGHSVIFAVRGKSLVADMSQRVSRLGIKHGVLMGDVRRERWHPVQVASIDTLHRMEHPPQASIVLVDEAQMSLSETWQKAMKRLPNAVIIGMSATPIGPNDKGLGRSSGGLFDSLVMGPTVLDLIADGYLCRSRHLEPPPIEGSREIKLGKNDNLAAQAAVFDKVKLIGDEIRHYKEHASGRKGVTFGTDQKHAYHIAEQFTQAGIPWAYVDADTPLGDEKNPQPGTRAAIYRDLDANNGTLMGVSSCLCTAIGWDHPIVSYLGIMRRTGSFGLWHQIMGRGSRICPSIKKENFIILDHAGNAELHRERGPYFESPIEWSLDGEAVKPGATKSFTIQTCKQSVLDCACGRTENHDQHNAHQPCFATFRPGPAQCPFCGCPILKKERKIETVDAPLVELQRPMFQAPLARQVANLFREEVDAAAAKESRMAQKKKQLDYLLREASSKGFLPGWARHRFIARYGEPPPVEFMPQEWRDSHQEVSQ